MTLPLLCPEVFQRFNVTPPRGVLFHGPPGTGKTLQVVDQGVDRYVSDTDLLCFFQSEGFINNFLPAFFMRKGADCLSKWVGEAERRLRFFFEEAHNCQPFFCFDEIDSLAPVHSSKQDQMHASIVSTLLALMDGMDGRGQVVIGVTNRPDAVDPALRGPGWFDREFYFALPGYEEVAWVGWCWGGFDQGQGEKSEGDDTGVSEDDEGIWRCRLEGNFIS